MSETKPEQRSTVERVAVKEVTEPDAAEELARVRRADAIGEAALARKAQDLVALDVRQLTSYADTLVLATGSSNRQTRAIADSVMEAATGWGEKPLGLEGYDDGRWVLIDFGDVIVHVFQQELRAFYDLERLWSDAPTLELEAAAAETASR